MSRENPEGAELNGGYLFLLCDQCQLYEVEANFLSLLTTRLVEHH